jgi:hypothetical protein
VGAQDFKNDRGFGGELFVATGRMTQDHGIGVIHHFIVPELDADEEVTGGGFAGFTLEAICSLADKVSTKALMIEAATGHGVDAAAEILMLDFGMAFAFEEFPGRHKEVCNFLSHAGR